MPGEGKPQRQAAALRTRSAEDAYPVRSLHLSFPCRRFMLPY